MSTTLSTSTMVAQVQKRVNIGLNAAMVLEDLNAAYRWLCQRGPMSWLVKNGTVTVTAGGVFDMPSDFDPGRPAVLWNPTLKNEIPYLSIDTFFKHQDYGVTAAPGLYSVWSFYPKPATVLFEGKVFPVAAVIPGGQLSIQYHSAPAVVAAASNVYFPSPDAFDTMLVDMAESEARRKYGWVGWQDIAKKAMDSALAVIDQYRTTRETLAGATDQARDANEVQAIRAK